MTLDTTAIQNLPLIGEGGPGKTPDFEAIIRSDADIIIASFLPKHLLNQLQKKTQIPVVALSYGSGYGGADNAAKLNAVKDSLRLLGKIFKKQKRADTLIGFMNENETILRHALRKKPTVYIGGIGYKGTQDITSSECGYAPFALLGLKNSFCNQSLGHMQVSLEQLLLSDVQLIFLDSLAKGLLNRQMQKHQTLFEAMQAYQNGAIYWLYPSNFYNTNIENIYLNSYIIAQKMGIELDIEAIKKQIYLTFLGDTFEN